MRFSGNPWKESEALSMIRNRAVSGEPLAVEDSAGYFKDGEHMTFDGITSQSVIQHGNSVDGKKVYNAVGSSKKEDVFWVFRSIQS